MKSIRREKAAHTTELSVASSSSASVKLPTGWSHRKNDHNGDEIFKIVPRKTLQTEISINSAGVHDLGTPLVVRPVNPPERSRHPVLFKEIELGELIGAPGSTGASEVRKASVSLGNSTSIHLVCKTFNDARTVDCEVGVLFTLQGRHPNIVKIFNIYYAHDQLSVLSERANSGSIEDLIRINGPLPLDVVAFILHEVLTGLAYLHERNIIYRNLKPSNVVIDYDKHGKPCAMCMQPCACKMAMCANVKLCDFAISKKIEGQMPGPDTTGIGSAHYRPPESMSGEKSRDPRCDTYQCGVLGGHCVFGCFPLRSMDELDALRNNPAIQSVRQLDTSYDNQFAFSARLKEKKVEIHYDRLNDEVAARQNGVRVEITPALLGFLGSCLKMNYEQRPTCEELLTNPFVHTLVRTIDESSFASYLHESKYFATRAAKKPKKTTSQGNSGVSASGKF